MDQVRGVEEVSEKHYQEASLEKYSIVQRVQGSKEECGIMQNEVAFKKCNKIGKWESHGKCRDCTRLALQCTE